MCVATIIGDTTNGFHCYLDGGGLVTSYNKNLADTERGYFGFYYNEDLSLSEIGEFEGITRQGVRDSIKRAEAQLLEMEERLGLAKRFREMRDGFEAIRAAAQDIQEYNDRYGYSREIDERAKRILTLSDHLSRT